MKNHPFQPGAVVAVRVLGSRFTHTPQSWRQDEVLKVHKNGNFTLKGDPKQQWRGRGPWEGWNKDKHIAEGSGAGHHYGTLHLLADIVETVKTDNEAFARWERWKAIERLLDRLPYNRVTDRSLSLFEEAIANLKPKEPT